MNTGTAIYYVKGAVTQKFDNIWDSKVTGKSRSSRTPTSLIDSDTRLRW